MMQATTLLVAAALAGSSDEPGVALGAAALDRAIRDEVRLAPARPPQAAAAPAPREAPGLAQEITVTEWLNEGLILPDYSAARVTERGFGVPRGGNSGSPSFDPVTREYWWE